MAHVQGYTSLSSERCKGFVTLLFSGDGTRDETLRTSARWLRDALYQNNVSSDHSTFVPLVSKKRPQKLIFVSKLSTGLSYVRHLKTVRTHLLWLVRHNKISSEENGVDYTQGLTEQVWRSLYHKGQVSLIL